jgi:hypothetical protein
MKDQVSMTMQTQESRTPKYLYKYRSFNANTLRILSRDEAYYADPTAFNDPLDCRPVLNVDTDLRTLEKLCYRMLTLTYGKDKAVATMNNHRYMSTEYGDFRTDEKAAYCYTEDLKQEVKALLYRELGKHGVLSLAARWDCPLMWSHYADEHRGLCVEYDTTDHRCSNLARVNYRTPGDIKISELYDWKIGKREKAERRVRNAFFYAKANEWRYEREWRDVASTIGADDAPLKMRAVYFGMRCDYAVVTSVVKLFINGASTIKFFDMYRRDNSFKLRRHPSNVEEIEIHGVQASRKWDFDGFNTE